MFIVFEGIDGAGTTTQTGLLCEAIGKLGAEVIRTCEPSDGPVGKLIRRYLRKEIPLGSDYGKAELALLFAADRLDHLDSKIRPALEKGKVVVSDRYRMSSLAYQSSDLPLEWVEEINSAAQEPDLTILLDLSPKVALERISSTRDGKELFEVEEHLERIAAIYRNLMYRLPEQAKMTVDGSLEIEEIHLAVLESVRVRLGL